MNKLFNITAPLAQISICLALYISVHPHVAAQNPQDDPDTVVLSDTLVYDDQKKESIFTGNVVMTSGDMTLHSDKLVISEDDNGFQYGVATVDKTDLVFIRQENTEKFEVIEARGLRGEYDGK